MAECGVPSRLIVTARRLAAVDQRRLWIPWRFTVFYDDMLMPLLGVLVQKRPERPVYPPADQAAVEECGTVKWYNAMKGFGFIASDRGGKDIFVHASALNRAGIADLAEGQRVAVDLIDGRKGPEAASLRLIYLPWPPADERSCG